MSARSHTRLTAEFSEVGGRAGALLPGVLVTIAITALAWAAATTTGVPVMLLALIFGLIAHNFLATGRYERGLQFVAKNVLRVGVALLGAGVVASEIAGLGWSVLLLCFCCVGLTIAVGVGTARLLGENAKAGLLFGGAVAICGASAALAIASAMPRDEQSEARTLLAVIGVTALSTVAMLIYPIAATSLNLSDKLAGIFFGATIHDVAQVVGAGYMLSDQAGETATMVKLVRVACLVPVVALVGFWMRPNGSGSNEGKPKEKIVPYFLLGFVFLSLVASANIFPAQAMQGLVDVGKGLLVAAIVALGSLTSLGALRAVGLRPLAMLLVPTIVLALFVLGLLVSLPGLFG